MSEPNWKALATELADVQRHLETGFSMTMATRRAELVEQIRGGSPPEPELQRLRKAIETMCPASDGFGEWFDELIELGVLVEVPSDAAFREEWGDQGTMYVYSWHPLAARKEADHVE